MFLTVFVFGKIRRMVLRAALLGFSTYRTMLV
jgi:hypothetical protein